MDPAVVLSILIHAHQNANEAPEGPRSRHEMKSQGDSTATILPHREDEDVDHRRD